MKKLKFICGLLVLSLISCEDDAPSTDNYLFKTSLINEKDLIISWENVPDNKLISIQIDTDELFDNPVYINKQNASVQKLEIKSLEPVRSYFVKIEVLSNSSVIYNDVIVFKTLYTKKTVSYLTPDNMELSCWLCYLTEEVSTESKVIIFMHEFTKTKSSWLETTLVDSLIKDGHLCVAFDFRGHGSSTIISDKTVLIQEPWLLITDFDATLNYLKTIDLNTSGQYIVLGASMGACVATTVSSYPEIIGGVAASAVKELSEKMISGTLSPKGMFFLAGELDKNESMNVDFERDANLLYSICTNPKKIHIAQGTANHGVMLLETDQELCSDVLYWVRTLK